MDEYKEYVEGFDSSSPVVKNLARSLAVPSGEKMDVFQKPDLSKIGNLNDLGIFLDPNAERLIAEQEAKRSTNPGLIEEKTHAQKVKEELDKINPKPIKPNIPSTESYNESFPEPQKINQSLPSKEIVFEDGDNTYKLVSGVAYKLDWVKCNSTEYKIIRKKTQREVNLDDVDIFIKGWKKVGAESNNLENEDQ